MAGVIVHEWLARTGGSENVFEVLGDVFPDAARFCLWNESDGRFRDVGETWLARTPLKGRKAAALPLMPLAWRHLPAVDAEWVLTSSHAFAHHARFAGSARHAPKLVYVHTPARYVWAPELDPRGANPAFRAVSELLKPLDRKRAQESVQIAANSAFIARRIENSWGRESRVIHPPVNVSYFAKPTDLPTDSEQAVLDALPDTFLFGVSRLVAYKRLDLVIAAGRAADLPVVIAGEGPDEERLRALAFEERASVTFIGRTSDAMLAELYRRSLAVVFAPIEDFGIIPVEAMAAGTPVIVNSIGGASESVIDGVTGAVMTDWSSSELRTAVEQAALLSPEACVARSLEFGREAFEDRVREWASPYTGGFA